jgi:hypothetical protein
MGSSFSKKKTIVLSIRTEASESCSSIFLKNSHPKVNLHLFKLLKLNEKSLKTIYEAPPDMELSMMIESSC